AVGGDSGATRAMGPRIAGKPFGALRAATSTTILATSDRSHAATWRKRPATALVNPAIGAFSRQASMLRACSKESPATAVEEMQKRDSRIETSRSFFIL